MIILTVIILTVFPSLASITVKVPLLLWSLSAMTLFGRFNSCWSVETHTESNRQKDVKAESVHESRGTFNIVEASEGGYSKTLLMDLIGLPSNLVIGSAYEYMQYTKDISPCNFVVRDVGTRDTLG